nr:hypothetical protein [Tanacetum cinerariifolium]
MPSPPRSYPLSSSPAYPTTNHHRCLVVSGGRWVGSGGGSDAKWTTPTLLWQSIFNLKKKTYRRGQEFNQETATYGNVGYFEDIDYFKDFENGFPTIFYKDALTPEPKVSSKQEYGRRVNIDEGFRVNVKHKSTEYKVRREKMFEVDEALDSENSKASSFQVRGNDRDMNYGLEP